MTMIVQLRDVQTEDLAIFFEYQRDPDAVRMADFPPRERAEHMLHWRTKVLGEPSARAMTIVLGDEVAGHVGSWGPPEARFLGYWIGKEHWGRGIATAALMQYLERDTMRPLHAIVAAHNAASMRVLEKRGFERVPASSARAALLDGDEDGILFRLSSRAV